MLWGYTLICWNAEGLHAKRKVATPGLAVVLNLFQLYVHSIKPMHCLCSLPTEGLPLGDCVRAVGLTF